jgi:hypothetical protein
MNRAFTLLRDFARSRNLCLSDLARAFGLCGFHPDRDLQVMTRPGAVL